MAQRFWVGGAGNTNDTAHWSLTSGGSGGASVPDATTDAVFNSASNATAYTVTVNAAFTCLSFLTSAPASGAMTLAGSSSMTVYGSYALHATLLRTFTGTLSFAGTTTGLTLSFAGLNPTTGATSFDGVGGVWTQQDAGNWGGILTLNAGTYNTNGKYVRTNAGFFTAGTGIRGLILGNSFIHCPNGNGWNVQTTTNLTFDAGTSTIYLQSASTLVQQSFNGGGLTYYNVILGTDTINLPAPLICVISGSNTFNMLEFGAGKSVLVTDGTTQTISKLVSNGVTGWPANITGTGTGGWTLANANAGATISADYLNISYCTATGGGFYVGANSTDGGHNSGLNFTPPPSVAVEVVGQFPAARRFNLVNYSGQPVGNPLIATELPYTFPDARRFLITAAP